MKLDFLRSIRERFGQSATYEREDRPEKSTAPMSRQACAHVDDDRYGRDYEPYHWVQASGHWFY